MQLQQWPSLWQQLLTWLSHRPEGQEPLPLPLSQAAARAHPVLPALPAGLQAAHPLHQALTPSHQLPLLRARAARPRHQPARQDRQVQAPTGTPVTHPVQPALHAGLPALLPPRQVPLPSSQLPLRAQTVRPRLLPVRQEQQVQAPTGAQIPVQVLPAAPAGQEPLPLRGQTAAQLRAPAAPAAPAAPLLRQAILSLLQALRMQLRQKGPTLLL